MEFREKTTKVYQNGEGNKEVHFDKVNGVCIRKVDVFNADVADLGVKRFEYLNCVNKFGKLLGFALNPPTTF